MIGLPDYITIRGIKIRVGCLSCQHKVVNAYGKRTCATHLTDVDPLNRCGDYLPAKMYQRICLGDGELRRVDTERGLRLQEEYHQALQNKRKR